MSPASRSKSKDKAAKAIKEQSKGSLKSSTPASNGNSNPGSAYNPISGTFHALETAPPSASLPTTQNNGRFLTIDESEEHSGSSLGTAAEYDSLSNNGSCSGESEDQKEKTSSNPRPETVPVSDSDKREKIRQKNEKKHQRQKERRAQELHERCRGYLMSRKLEGLAQTLVAMGFSTERATVALIVNEGHVEDSVAWLFEGGEESKQESTENLDGSNLKIDITDELARIAVLERKFKCTKQEVERAVVSCEGDLEKADDTLKAQKQEPTNVPPRFEQSGYSISSASELSNKVPFSVQSSAARTQPKVISQVTMQQHRRDERDFNYTKGVVAGNVQIDTNRNLQSLKKAQPKPDWARPQSAPPVDKRWPGANSSPSVSFALASPLQATAPQMKSEARYVMGGHEAKTKLQQGMLKEPIIVMQRPQSNSSKQNLMSTSMDFSASPSPSTGWQQNGPSGIEMMMAAGSNGLVHQLGNLSMNGSSAYQQLYPQNHYQPFVSSPMESNISGQSGSWNNTAATSNRRTPSLSLCMPSSSLGLFSGFGSSRSSCSPSTVDWSTGGSMPQCDYANVDWSIDHAALMQPSLKSNQLYETWSTTYRGGKGGSGPAAVNGVCLAGLQDRIRMTDSPSSVGSHEWTSPFNGEDIFRASRQYVTSPSL